MMGVLGVVFLVAFAGLTVSAEPVPVFPELAREFSGSRIVSGWEASEGQLPYQISMRMVNRQGGVNACGGSIIHAEWGLTAAHCTADRITMVLRLGLVNLTRPGLMFETTTYYNHPSYDASIPGIVQPNDVALLKFGRVVTFNEYIQPIRIQPSVHMNRNYDGVRMVASGWGRTWTESASPEHLNWVFLSGVTNFVCWLAYGGSPIIQDSTICAEYYNVTSQSTCQGDSGGPLVTDEDYAVLTQVGVTSFVSGAGCHTEHPAGFIRPGHYHDWYLEVTGINFDWDPDTNYTTTSTDAPTTTTSTPDCTNATTEGYNTTTTQESGEETTVTTQEPEGPTDVPTVNTEAPEEETTPTDVPEVEPPTTYSPESEEEEEETTATTQGPEEVTESSSSSESEEDDDDGVEEAGNKFLYGYFSRLW